ncbi:hypothetical protein [Photobacterium sp. 1_MG-2023]|uniref:hypothetical protein n=1 Tax=Photobacterium sp. 1_MG-2023 TaxID=3062646 RepID=UPI0026E18B4F|nr:hypothetical protein [Photobacterium sp. 1_MG-2023]MDO6705384.1 hypothetical protein [Photobacterium sp. 1_MG-2023]
MNPLSSLQKNAGKSLKKFLFSPSSYSKRSRPCNDEAAEIVSVIEEFRHAFENGRQQAGCRRFGVDENGIKKAVEVTAGNKRDGCCYT